MNILQELSYESKIGKSFVNSIRKFDRNILFEEIAEVIRFYQEADVLNDVDLDYRIKSKDSCIRKYNKFYPEMRVEKVFNDILGFRMLVDNYNYLLKTKAIEKVRIVDLSHGKANDDGYRGVHLYSDSVGRILRREYENGKIINEQKFEEALQNVLSDSKIGRAHV